VTGRHLGRASRRASFAALVSATALIAAACGSSDTSPTSAPVATTTAAPATSAPAESPAAVATKPSTSESPVQAPKAAKIEVPRGVGLDYQSAQDLWRAAGLHVAPAKDATGANRIPVIDSNWVVVSQDPKAGSMADAGTFITATVKKDSDD
jgi:hypothetical protein